MMVGTPPPFYSRRRTRTRPAHRRIEVDPGPDLARFRRRPSRTSMILAAFITIVGIGIGTASVRQPRTAPPTVTLPSMAPAGAIPVAVTHIADGDTLDVRSAQTTLRVRLYGVNTPERGQACYGEATQRLAALAGDQVLLVPDARTQDQYGRECVMSLHRTVARSTLRSSQRATRRRGARMAAAGTP